MIITGKAILTGSGSPDKDGLQGVPGKDSTTIAAGEVGSYVFAMNSNTYKLYGLGYTVSGSEISTAGVYCASITSQVASIIQGVKLTGTWECQGYSYSYQGATLWKRIA
ncbi:hypothetical protein QLL71_004340 [Salmonella enterica]|nr:hypothetical protein [Salmonella enterica]